MSGGTFVDWGCETEIDAERREFVVRIPFAPAELPYYPILIAATIVGRATATLYHHLPKGYLGLSGVRVDGQVHVTHDSLLEYIRQRSLSAEEQLNRRRATIEKMVPTLHAKVRAPKPIVPTPAAETLVAAGELDFMNDLFPADGTAEYVPSPAEQRDRALVAAAADAAGGTT